MRYRAEPTGRGARPFGRLAVDLRRRERLWPYLWLGQWTHAGKGTSMGLGRYRLTAGGDGSDDAYPCP